MDATENLSWSQKDLDEWADILVRAEDIRADVNKYDAVTRYMKNKGAKITRISDLRRCLSDPDNKREKDGGYSN